MTDSRAQVFSTVQELSKYTKATEKYFPRDEIEAGALLKYLLRQINHPPTRERGTGGRGRGSRGRGTRRIGA